MRRIECFAILAICLASVPAWAAKEKFERTKPHVNVGTIGLNNESLSLSVGLVSVEDQVTGGSSDPSVCGGVFDVRVVDADDPSGTPLSETTDVRLGANERTTLGYVGGSTPEEVYVVVVARDMDNVKAKGCILRGRIDIVDNSGGSRRSIELRPEDFVKTKKF